MAFSDKQSNPWNSTAGFNRGITSYVTDLAIKPNNAQRDLLYKISCNTISEYPEGFVILSAKTLLKKPSAFSNINVRRAFLLAERA